MAQSFRTIAFILTVCVVFFGGRTERAHAEAVFLKSDSTRYAVGQSFLVHLACDTSGNVINTVSGSVVVPTDMIDVSDLRYGNSVVSLWVDKPTYDAQKGIISFSGGIPGGFNNSDAPILSFVARAKKAGSARIGLSGFSLLLNDGTGTEVKDLSLLPFGVRIVESRGEVPELFVAERDSMPPENIEAVVSTDRTVGNGNYFVSFFAVDKDSGIDRYEIMETPFFMPFARGDWVQSDSPYILREQVWITKVTVRAYDGAGNYKDVVTIKPMKGVHVVALCLLLLTCVYLFRRFRFARKKK